MPSRSSAKSTRTDTKAGRFYTLPDGRSVPSVTTILGCIGKPALVSWAAKQERVLVIDAAADLYLDLQQTPAMTRPTFVASLESRIGKQRAFQRELAKAGDIGTQAHALVEWLLRQGMGLPIGPEPRVCDKAMWAVMAWQDWARSVSLRPLWVEQMVWSETHGYAGTMDLLAEVNGRQVVIDWKTSKAIYAEAHLQNVAYQVAVTEMGHGAPVGGYIVRLPKNEDDPAFEVAEVGSVDTLFPVFLHTKGLWNWTYQQELAYQETRKAASSKEAA